VSGRLLGGASEGLRALLTHGVLPKLMIPVKAPAQQDNLVLMTFLEHHVADHVSCSL